MYFKYVFYILGYQILPIPVPYQGPLAINSLPNCFYILVSSCGQSLRQVEGVSLFCRHYPASYFQKTMVSFRNVHTTLIYNIRNIYSHI